MKRTVLLTLILGLAIPAAARNKKVAPDVAQSGNDSMDVIVQFRTSPTQKHYDKIGNRGGRVMHDLSVVNGLHASMTPAQVDALAADPEVTHISPDRPLHSTSKSNSNNTSIGSPTAVLDYHTDTVNAPVAWAQGLDGTGIGVAVIDSGIIDTLPDFYTPNARVVFSQNFTSKTINANDQYGHGIHVAGVIGGNGYKSTGPRYSYTFKGIAPNVNLIDLRVLDQNGVGTDSQVIAAIQMAIQLKSTYNIRVINLSLGRPVYESYTLDPLCQAVEAAYQAGIVVVVAAGNNGRDNSLGTNGYATITAPANDPYVITVGAMKTLGTPSRADDQITTYSSKGTNALRPCCQA